MDMKFVKKWMLSCFAFDETGIIFLWKIALMIGFVPTNKITTQLNDCLSNGLHTMTVNLRLSLAKD